MPEESGVPARPPRLAAVVCAVLEDEVLGLIQRHGLNCQVDLVEQGLHDEPDELRRVLQTRIDLLDDQPDLAGIALVYGLCSRGTEGLHTRRLPLAIPRAHDCITLLLGDRRHYAAEIATAPGSYWYSPGWIKHTLMPSIARRDQRLAEYQEQFGEDNATYLMETMESWLHGYDRAVFVDQGLGAVEEGAAFTRRCADELGWRCDRLTGDAGLLHRLLAGDWRDAEVAVLRPGQTIRMNADADRIVDIIDDQGPP